MISRKEIEGLGWELTPSSGYSKPPYSYIWFEQKTGTTREGLWRLKFEPDISRVTIEQGPHWPRFFGYPGNKDELAVVMRQIGMGIEFPDLSEDAYNRYMVVLVDKIKQFEDERPDYDLNKRIATMSHSDWSNWQKTGVYPWLKKIISKK